MFHKPRSLIHKGGRLFQKRRVEADPHEERKQHFFVCGTNRPCLRDPDRREGPDNPSLEKQMHVHCYAAIWEYDKKNCKSRVRWPEVMQGVCPHDLIFMFGSSRGGVEWGPKGIIGVGEAIEFGPNEPILLGDERRLRIDKGHPEEWRVKVDWLCWDMQNPCPFIGENASFYNVTGQEQVKAVIEWTKKRTSTTSWLLAPL